MIQDRPICFDCIEPIDSVSDAVFANPLRDADKAPSAIFHPLCLMRWRERRAEVKARMESVRQAFEQHLNGECGCEEA